MVLYDFECCNTKCPIKYFEKSVEIDTKEIKCPECHEVAKRIISNPKHYKHLSWSKWKVS